MIYQKKLESINIKDWPNKLVIERFINMNILQADKLKETKEYLNKIQENITSFYWVLFNLGVGERFHPMLEWCGVMSEYIKIHQALLDEGIDATNSDIHNGIGSKIPKYQLNYLAEKLNCIFSGMLEVKVRN